MLKLTPLQIVGIILIVNGALSGSVGELTDLLGPVWAKHILSIAVIGSGICGGFVTMFGGTGTQIRNVVADPQAQEALVKAVLAMRGVEKININAQANTVLATMAVDPAINKIAPTQASMQEVTATAKAAT